MSNVRNRRFEMWKDYLVNRPRVGIDNRAAVGGVYTFDPEILHRAITIVQTVKSARMMFRNPTLDQLFNVNETWSSHLFRAFRTDRLIQASRPIGLAAGFCGGSSKSGNDAAPRKRLCRQNPIHPTLVLLCHKT